MFMQLSLEISTISFISFGMCFLSTSFERQMSVRIF